MLDVTILFLRGGLASTAIAPMEVFRGAGVAWNLINGEPARPLFRVRTASIDGKPVDYDWPLQIVPEASLDQIRKTDLLILSSTGLETEQLLARHGRVIPWLRRLHRGGASVAAICSGVALLAEAGLLGGKPATTHWGLAELYRRKYPRIDWQPELYITEADNVYCGGGVYASLDLSLYLVEKFAGHDIAVQCGKALLIDTPRTWQSGFAAPPPRAGHRDDAIRRVQEWLHENFRRGVRFHDVARRAGMSPRNFVRRFKQATGEPPLTYLHKLRVAGAKHLLEQDHTTVQEVAGAVGYEDVAFFRDLFKRYTRISPQSYRARFGRPPLPSSHRRAAAVPLGSLLERVPHAQHGGLVERPPGELERARQSRRRESAGQRQRGQAGHVEGRRVAAGERVRQIRVLGEGEGHGRAQHRR
jgi:transcriptional regulator GlxA family with amidase domain